MLPFSYAALQQQQPQSHHHPHAHVPYPSHSPPLSLAPPPSPSPLQAPLTPLSTTPSTVKAFNYWPTSTPSSGGFTSPLHSSSTTSSTSTALTSTTPHPPLSNHLHHLTLSAPSSSSSAFNGLSAAAISTASAPSSTSTSSSSTAQTQTQTLISASAYSAQLQPMKQQPQQQMTQQSMLHLLYPGGSMMAGAQPLQATAASSSSPNLTSLPPHLNQPLIASLLQRHAQQQHNWQQQQMQPNPLHHSHASMGQSLAPPSSLSFLLPSSGLLSTSTSSPSDLSSSPFTHLPISPSNRSLLSLNTTSPVNGALPTPTSASLNPTSTSTSDTSIGGLLRRAETAEQQRDAAFGAIQQAVALLKSSTSAAAASSASSSPALLQCGGALQLLCDFLSAAQSLVVQPTTDVPVPLSSFNLSQVSGIGLKRRIPSAFHPVPGQGTTSTHRLTREDSDGGRHTPLDTAQFKDDPPPPRRQSHSGKRKRRRRSGGSRPSSDSDSSAGEGEGGGEGPKQLQRDASSSSCGEEEGDGEGEGEGEEEDGSADSVAATPRASAVASPPNVLSRLTLKKKRDRSCLPCPLIHHINKTPIRVVDVHIEREYTLSKRDAAALSKDDRASLVKVGVRFLANASPSSEVYVVAKDICLLIHTRKGNVAKSIGQFGPGEKARMAVICPRSDGTVSTHVLTVLSVSGVRRLLAGSRSRVVGKVRGWMFHQLISMGHPDAALFNETEHSNHHQTSPITAPPITQTGAEEGAAMPSAADRGAAQHTPMSVDTDTPLSKQAGVEPISSSSPRSAGDAREERLLQLSAPKLSSPTAASAFSALRGLTRASFSSLPTIPSTNSLSSSFSTPSSPSPPASHENSPKGGGSSAFSFASTSGPPAISAASGY